MFLLLCVVASIFDGVAVIVVVQFVEIRGVVVAAAVVAVIAVAVNAVKEIARCTFSEIST